LSSPLLLRGCFAPPGYLEVTALRSYCCSTAQHGYFRGREYTQDLVVGDGLWRWDETLAKPTYRFQVLPLTKSDHYTIAADAIAAVHSPTNNKETLMFIWNINVPKSMTDGSPLVLSEFGEMWLENDGKTVKRKLSWAADVFGWGKVGEQLGSTNWTEQTKFYRRRTPTPSARSSPSEAPYPVYRTTTTAISGSAGTWCGTTSRMPAASIPL